MSSPAAVATLVATFLVLASAVPSPDAEPGHFGGFRGGFGGFGGGFGGIGGYGGYGYRGKRSPVAEANPEPGFLGGFHRVRYGGYRGGYEKDFEDFEDIHDRETYDATDALEDIKEHRGFGGYGRGFYG